MDSEFQESFLRNWKRYFPGAELPIGYYYADAPLRNCLVKPPQAHRCVMADIAKVRRGKAICLDKHNISCPGGKRYLGFSQELMPEFAYFLSYGIPGKLEGERYKKTPQLVNEHLKNQQPFTAPAGYLIFKRWDIMEESDQPLAAIFFAEPDVLSGLFTLANFDEPQPHGVIAPFGAGCASLVDYPYQELQSPQPRAVLGMFDVSARPCVPAGVLTFTVPWPKFTRMAANMAESFLITKSWNKVRRRLQRSNQNG